MHPPSTDGRALGTSALAWGTGLDLVIAAARNDLLFAEDGRSYIDMFTAHGTTWLGHGNEAVKAALAEQLEKVWITGALATAVRAEAEAVTASFFPASHRLAGFYSTGMEAAEFALRIARVATGRTGAAGFARSMHGKSTATSYLCWDNQDGLDLSPFHRLPFVPACPEEEVLHQLECLLESRQISAVLVEPIQGSGGGHRASPAFHHAVQRLCRAYGSLLVFDEILTGFYRTGSAFVFEALGLTPDIVLIGKALGNGFPISAVAVDHRIPLSGAMLPGSTYSGNPLAAAAALATLRQMQAMDLPQLVARIEEAILRILGPVRDAGIALRGQGALWILELPSRLDARSVVLDIYHQGVCVGYTGRLIRLLPAATIAQAHLERACTIIRDELLLAREKLPQAGS